MFQYISRYTPQTVELDTKLRPFIPEYIPAIGDIDAFLKVRTLPAVPVLWAHTHISTTVAIMYLCQLT